MAFPTYYSTNLFVDIKTVSKQEGRKNAVCAWVV